MSHAIRLIDMIVSIKNGVVKQIETANKFFRLCRLRGARM